MYSTPNSWHDRSAASLTYSGSPRRPWAVNPNLVAIKTSARLPVRRSLYALSATALLDRNYKGPFSDQSLPFPIHVCCVPMRTAVLIKKVKNLKKLMSNLGLNMEWKVPWGGRRKAGGGRIPRRQCHLYRSQLREWWSFQFFWEASLTGLTLAMAGCTGQYASKRKYEVAHSHVKPVYSACILQCQWHPQFLTIHRSGILSTIQTTI